MSINFFKNLTSFYHLPIAVTLDLPKNLNFCIISNNIQNININLNFMNWEPLNNSLDDKLTH